MVATGRLPAAERIALAEVQGIARRYATGRDRDRGQADAVAELRAVTTDPRLLGIAAGIAAADPTGAGDLAAELLIAAGGNQTTAVEQTRKIRERMEAGGIRYPDDGM
jgi:hypothetical protein